MTWQSSATARRRHRGQPAGPAGLNVVVVERDPDIYARARAISTDEEVVRIWQQVGTGRPAQRRHATGQRRELRRRRRRAFRAAAAGVRGNGHPPQQFIYQPALEKVLRDGVDRFPKVAVLLEHECLRVIQRNEHVELMLADLRRRVPPHPGLLRDRRRRRVQPHPRPVERRLRGPHLRRALDRHRHRSAQGLARPRPAAVPLQPGTSHRRLPHSAGPSPLGIPGAATARTKTTC